MTISPNSLIGKAGMSEMEIQQARADAILSDFTAGVNEATGLPTIETPGYVIVPAAGLPQIDADTTAEEEVGQTRQSTTRDPLAPANLPIEAQASLAAGMRDYLRLADGELEARLAPLMREIDEARTLHAEATKAKRETVAEIESRIRAHVLDKKESLRGPYFLCSYVSASTSAKWNDKGLTGAVAMLPDNWREAIMRHRTVEVKAATTRWTAK